MLHVNNLMIGDWVNYRPGWKDEETGQIEFECGAGFPVKIEMLYFCCNKGLVQYNDGENDGIEAADYELFPIPLTPEILEKNGFERSEVFVEWKYKKDNVYMIYKPFPYLKIQTEECIVAFPCEYIHQLQHALRLCGIEKEITL